MTTPNRVVIIGAGVLGLSCALRLKRAGFQVAIVARDLPGDLDIDYASPWAGAHFRPVPVTTEAERLERDLSAETYEFLEQVVQLHPDAGLSFCPGHEYFEQPSTAHTDLKPKRDYNTWPGFQVLPRDRLPLSAQWGVTYNAWVIDSPRYLRWLQAELGKDAIIIKSHVQTPRDALMAVEAAATPLSFVAVVNASGMGLSDEASFISRGQFLHISNPYDRTISYHCADGSSIVVVPRMGMAGTLIGGSKEPGDSNPHANDDTTAWIKRRVTELCPDLQEKSGLDVMSVNVGRRPMRKGGPRIELDDVSTGMCSLPIVHCYGAGGSGFKISWGAARKVQELVQGLMVSRGSVPTMNRH